MKTIIKADIIDNYGNTIISLPEYVGQSYENVEILRKEISEKYMKPKKFILFTYTS